MFTLTAPRKLDQEGNVSSLKRFFFAAESIIFSSDIEATEYAKYGISQGKLSCPKRGEYSCMIFSRGWPSWLWSALSRGIDVKLIILSDATWISLVKTSAPASNVIVWSDVRDISCLVILIYRVN